MIRESEVELVMKCRDLYESGLHGWVSIPEVQDGFGAENPFDDFSKVAGDLLDHKPLPTYLWRILNAGFQAQRPGFRFSPQYQRRLTCVAQAAKVACDVLFARQNLLKGKPIPGRATVCSLHAGAKVDIGGYPGQRHDPKADASNMTWLLKYLSWRGVLLQHALLEAPLDDVSGDENIGLRWAAQPFRNERNTISGVPEAEFSLLQFAHPLKASSRLRSFAECASAIRNGYPIVLCSKLLSDGKRDKDGFSKFYERGGHAVVGMGVRFDPKPGILLVESFSEKWGSGPKFPIDQPDGSIWADEETIEQMLLSGDCHAFSDTTGFEKNDEYLDRRI